jgi:hypothetical protein
MTDVSQRIAEPEIDERCGPYVDDAVLQMQADGIAELDIAHALVSEGLAHFRGCMCAEHVLEQLAFVRQFIDDKTEELRKECG